MVITGIDREPKVTEVGCFFGRKRHVGDDEFLIRQKSVGVDVGQCGAFKTFVTHNNRVHCNNKGIVEIGGKIEVGAGAGVVVRTGVRGRRCFGSASLACG